MDVKFVPFPEFLTKRLHIRKLIPTDAPELFLLRSDKKHNQFIDRNRDKAEEDTLRFIGSIDSAISKGESIFWAVSKRNDTKLIGTICLWNFDLAAKTADIGYELNRIHQNHGFMSEAVQETLNYGFSKLKLQAINAYTNVNNHASIGLLSKFGFVKKMKPLEDSDPYSCYVLTNILT